MVTRIRQLLEQKQLTPTQFADAIGVGRPVMSHILSERNKPSLEVVQRIIDAFPEVSMSWLLRGTGEMLESGSTPAAEAATPPTKLAVPTPSHSVAPAPMASEPERLPAVPVPPVVEPIIAPLDAEPVVIATEPVASASRTQVEPVAMEGPAITPSTIALAQPEASSQPSPPVAPPTPGALKPFKAQRFVPASALPVQATQAQVTTPVAPLPPTALTAPPVVPAIPSMALPVAPLPFVPASLPAEASPASPSSPTSPTASPEAAILPFLGEPGKAIRRIVIFYRDGSFADYQPEQ